MSPEDRQRIHESGERTKQYLARNHKPCSVCEGSGELFSLWIFTWTCPHCQGSGKEPLVKYRRNGSPYIDFDSVVDE